MARPEPETEHRVLVLMPTAQDAARACALLAAAGMAGTACADIEAVCRALRVGAGVVLLTDEAVGGAGGDRLTAALDAQPAWSDVPLVVLTREGADARYAPFRESANATLVERPVRMRSLLSVVRAALRSRRRQYEVRDLLAERQRSAEALRAERERYRVTLSSIGDAVIATDAAGRVTFLNPVAESLTGWAPAEAAGRPLAAVFRVVNEATRREVENPALRALESGAVVGLANHTVLIARDGTERPIDDSAAPIRAEGGAVAGAVLVFRDITGRRAAEASLRESERRHRVLAELAAATQPLTDPAAIMAASARLLAEHLGADRCAYAAVEGESVYVITGDHTRGVPSIVGRWPVAAFGAEHHRMMRANEPYVVEDAGADPRVGPADLPAYRATAIGAVICVPLHKGGVFTAAMAVHQRAPRRWTPGEVELVATVAGRCWEALERARVEQTLRESEARYRAIVEATPECVKLVAPDGTLLQMNRAGLAMVEGDESALGQCVYDVIAPEDRDRFRAFNERVCRGERGTLEFDVIGLRGTRRHMETTAVPLPTPDGAFTQLAVTRDVTSRRRTEAAVRERDERLQLFLGNATDYAVIISDPDDRAVEWLGGAERITGWRADEAIGRSLDVIFTPEDRAAGVPRAETSRAAEAGRAENTRWHLRKDGTRFFAEGVTVSIRGPAGELRGFGKVFRDATARKLAEERLTRDAAILANVHDAVVLTDPDGVVTYWNEGATRLFGWTAGETVGRPYAARFDEPVRSRVAGEIRKRAGGAEWSGEYEDYRRDGSRVWIDARVTCIRDATGRAVGVLGVSHDITERKRAEDALREADRKKDEFIALLAHELRNPLAPIRNGLQVIRMAGDRATRERAQAMMDRQLAHMVRMIDDLLDVSRIGRNKMELRRARVALADVVGSAVETARPAVEEAGHELAVSLPPHPVFVDADLTRLSQVLSNLLTNSAKYTPRGGRIRLSAGLGAGGVVLSVRDNGIGIPADALPTVFDMFSQVNRSAERSAGGLGIGLALVKGLVEMHGGTVSVRSEGEGRGSEFTVTLPAATVRPAEAAGGPADGPAVTGRRRRILVVDDNRDGAESLAEMLRLSGNEAALAHDGVEAVERAEAVRPEVILMDVGMPRMDGLEATRRIRERPWGRGVTIIALTGWGQDGDRRRSREAGCDGHLVKPVSLADLELALAELGGR